jgi:hypothetical protein
MADVNVASLGVQIYLEGLEKIKELPKEINKATSALKNLSSTGTKDIEKFADAGVKDIKKVSDEMKDLAETGWTNIENIFGSFSNTLGHGPFKEWIRDAQGAYGEIKEIATGIYDTTKAISGFTNAARTAYESKMPTSTSAITDTALEAAMTASKAISGAGAKKEGGTGGKELSDIQAITAALQIKDLMLDKDTAETYYNAMNLSAQAIASQEALLGIEEIGVGSAASIPPVGGLSLAVDALTGSTLAFLAANAEVIAVLIVVLAAVGAALAVFKVMWDSNFLGIADVVENTIGKVIDDFSILYDSILNLMEALTNLYDRSATARA